MTVPIGTLGYDDHWRALTAELGLPGQRVARVVRTDVGRRLVQVPDGNDLTGQVVSAVDPGHGSTTGDWVLIGQDDRICGLLPRRTELIRGAGRKDARPQVLAANVDLVGVVHALSAPPNAGRIERMLAIAWSSGATPLVVLTKADLAVDPDGDVAEVTTISPGAEVVAVSTLSGHPSGDGIDRIAELLSPDRTAVFVGPSGSGKSSLINALAGRSALAVGETRSDGKGRHTSTTRELVTLPGGGMVIDTPGLRGVQVWDVDGVDSTFSDVLELAGSCRFNDCSHHDEPGCAVQASIADGSLPARRLAGYEKLRREQEWLAMRYDARLRAEAKAEWKRRHRAGQLAAQYKRTGR